MAEENKEKEVNTVEKKGTKKELTEEELKSINGGGWWSASGLYESGDNYAFAIGERVIVRISYLYTERFYEATIIKQLSKSHNVLSEWRYEVRYDDGSTEGDIFESQMVYSDEFGTWRKSKGGGRVFGW